MRAVILAAGVGGRMAPLTEACHKTLLMVGGQTILGRILGSLERRGVCDVTIVTGYRADDIHAFVAGSFSHLSVTFVHNERYAETNNIYSAALAFADGNSCDEETLLIESDLVFQPAVLDLLIDSPHPNVALVDRFGQGMDGTVVAINDDQRIRDVIPLANQAKGFDYSNVYKTLNMYKFSKAFMEGPFPRLLQHCASSIDDGIYYELIIGMVVYLNREHLWAEVVGPQSWAEVDDPNDLRVARLLMQPESRRRELDGMWGGFWSAPVLDFGFIRNMHFPTDAMTEDLRVGLAGLMQNYGSTQRIVDEKLSYALRCSATRVVCLNGAAQAFPILAKILPDRAASTPGKGKVAIPEPTFGEYRSWFPDAIGYSLIGRVGVGDLEALAAKRSVLVVVNPNNPTGQLWSSARLHWLAKRFPDCMLVIDESFIEFSGERSMIELLEAAPLDNVIVLKSLSKTWGVPGLRIGALYSTNPEVVAAVHASLPIWNTNSVAERFLELVVKHRSVLDASFRRTIADRNLFMADLAEHPLVSHVYPSGANFVLVRLAIDKESAAVAADRICEDFFIYVKDIGSKFDDRWGYWRLAVRTTEDHERLFEALDRVTQLQTINKSRMRHPSWDTTKSAPSARPSHASTFPRIHLVERAATFGGGSGPTETMIDVTGTDSNPVSPRATRTKAGSSTSPRS